jgi:hypothetical protein
VGHPLRGGPGGDPALVGRDSGRSGSGDSGMRICWTRLSRHAQSGADAGSPGRGTRPARRPARHTPTDKLTSNFRLAGPAHMIQGQPRRDPHAHRDRLHSSEPQAAPRRPRQGDGRAHPGPAPRRPGGAPESQHHRVGRVALHAHRGQHRALGDPGAEAAHLGRGRLRGEARPAARRAGHRHVHRGGAGAPDQGRGPLPGVHGEGVGRYRRADRGRAPGAARQDHHGQAARRHVGGSVPGAGGPHPRHDPPGRDRAGAHADRRRIRRRCASAG